VLGTPLALSDYDGVLDWIDATVAAGARASVSAAAVNLVMLAREDEEIRRAVQAMTLVVPDGQPLVWALHALGHSQATRVYGPELMSRHCARAARAGTPIYLFGGRNAGALVSLTLALRERFPGIQIAGAHATPFTPPTAERDDSDAERIERSGAAVVWVGTGQPRQELWMSRMRERLSAPVLLGVGAAFDFHAGLVRQAPPWIGDHGLEWVYRLSREPRRLWRRYARHNPRFVVAFVRQYASERAARHDAGGGR
jgi:N-acetylglucosaminyldiphosphoundecaprenol N-acetyl-beta-D-mannosaminyltransferase